MAIDKLTITGATSGTINLHTTEYSMQEETYQPAVAQRDTTRIGGTSLLTPVLDGFTLVIRGATKTAVKASLNDFIQAMDQADRWFRREPVNPILLNWAADGGGVTTQATILKVLSDRQKWLQMPISYHEDLDKFIIRPIRVRFLRSGYWLAAEESVNSSAANNPEKMTATFTGSPDIDSPLELRLEYANWPNSITFDVPDCTLLVARASDRLLIANSTSFNGVGFSDQSDPGTNSRSGSVSRYTPFDTAEKEASSPIGGSLADDIRRVALYMNFRSNISAVTWTIKAKIRATLFDTNYTPALTISGADILTPTWMYLGTVSIPIGMSPDILYLNVSASTTTGSPVLDSDVFAVLALDDPTARVVNIKAQTSNAQNPADFYVRITHGELEQFDPAIQLWDGNGPIQIYAPSHQGDLYLYTRGATVVASVLGTEGSNWRMLNDATPTPAVLQFAINARRRKAYLVPQ